MTSRSVASRVRQLVTIALVLAMPALAQADTAKLGQIFKHLIDNKDAFMEVNEEREIEIGRTSAARLLGAVPLVKNKQVQDYVNKVGLWVALRSERPGLPWRFGVLDSPTVNAFAAPGGFIFITKGLMQRMSNEAELAGVLAHEVSHVVKRHHLAAIQTRARAALATSVAVTAATDSGELGQKLAGVGVQLWSEGLDRDDELEADRRGVVLAGRAGYDAFGLAAVLETLAALNPGAEEMAFMGSTHPTPLVRLQALDNELDTRFDKVSNAQTVDARFVKIRNKLK